LVSSYLPVFKVFGQRDEWVSLTILSGRIGYELACYRSQFLIAGGIYATYGLIRRYY